jgi:hypothetical protein
VAGSLLLMDVGAIAQTECDVCVVRWNEAMLSEPTVCPYRGEERRSDDVT